MRTLAGLALALTLAFPALAAEGLPLKTARHIAFDTDEATWLSLDVAPDGRTLVMEILGDLYALDANGGKTRVISSGLAFDSQPVFSPDGSRIAFLSDRSGAENVWTSKPDGSDAKQVSRNDLPHEYASPAWSADGKQIYASFYRSDRNAVELWRFPAAGGDGEELTKKAFSALGARPSPDGRYLYYAARSGPVFEDDVVLPLWSIHRRDLKANGDETLITNQGSAMRPVPSPDGRLLAYAARLDGRTILRLRDLQTGADRVLADPITRDAQEATATRDLVPGYAFTPDSRAVLITVGGKIARIDVVAGAKTAVPFTAQVSIDAGPQLRQDLREETGPVRARLIQQPVQSPDGKTLAFSALGRIYTMALPGGTPQLMSQFGPPQYMPAWSPDGRQLAFITWTAKGGAVWLRDSNGAGSMRRVDGVDAYYTNPVFAPDGKSLMVLRSGTYDRQHTAQEPLWTGRSLGPLRQAELVELPLDGGAPKVLASGPLSGDPQFDLTDDGAVFVNSDKGLDRVARDGAGRKTVLKVEGPGYYFLEDEVDADDIRLSPDGKFALVQANQQLHLIEAPNTKGVEEAIDLSKPSVRHRALTSVGADFFGWADGGKTITWAVGSTFYRRPLSSITLEPAGQQAKPADRPAAGKDGVEAYQAAVDLPRDVQPVSVVLRGATVVTMRGGEVIRNADVVVVQDRITAVGPRGKVEIPHDAVVRDMSGKWIIPGLIDVHDHFGEIRRGVLEWPDWGLQATLAYGVTSALDPSTLSIDMLAYQDLIDAGVMKGPRLYNTSVAIFSYNRLKSLQETRDLVSRYVDHYRTRNLKLYRTGNRAQRQWVVMAAHDLGAMPVAEGALDAKLDLTQLIDGVSGNEHALGIAPLYRDVIELQVRLRASYDMTLQISHGGPPAGEDFIVRDRPHEDAKIAGLYPHFIRDKLYTRAHWVDRQEQAYPLAAAAAAAIQRAGGLVSVGSHGNYPGVGFHWEMQAYAAGGWTPAEVLHAATIGSAEAIGRKAELGSLEPGKFADLVVLSRDPLADVRNMTAIDQVMKNGRLYDGTTLDQVWPNREAPSEPWWAQENAEPGAPR